MRDRTEQARAGARAADVITYKGIQRPECYLQMDNPYDKSSTCWPTSNGSALATMRATGAKMPEEFAQGNIAHAILDDLLRNDNVYRHEWADKGRLACRYFGAFWQYWFSYYADFFETKVGQLPENPEFRVAELYRLIADGWLPILGTVIDVGRDVTSGHRRLAWGADPETLTVALSDPWGKDVSVDTPDGYYPYSDKSDGVYWKHIEDVESERGMEVSWLWNGAYFAIRAKQ